MIAESPRILLMLLAATSVLGAVMGYCVALLQAKSRASDAINAVRVELGKKSGEKELDLDSARQRIAGLQGAVSMHHERTNKSIQREEALQLHSQLQAQRISTLEAQLATYEDQQIRLQRDFASYKSNKSRELELARSNPESWAEADSLPVLSKRIGADEVETEIGSHGRIDAIPSQGVVVTKGKERLGLSRRDDSDRLSKPLSRELDIPTLSESELPDSVDGLEFELVDMDGTGAWPRG